LVFGGSLEVHPSATLMDNRAKRIIANSIKDHLIPQVSSKNTPKEMFDALTEMFEGKNINRKMNFRTQLKNTKMQKG
jgi:hypothetical protein